MFFKECINNVLVEVFGKFLILISNLSVSSKVKNYLLSLANQKIVITWINKKENIYCLPTLKEFKNIFFFKKELKSGHKNELFFLKYFFNF